MAQTPVKPPIAVWVLTGFLGAGKTTTLNQLLKAPLLVDRHQALIINEFGKMGVDGSLVEPGDFTLYEINRGSIFCSCTQAELISTLETLALEIQPEHLVLEATGIAQPSDLEPLIKASTYGDFFEIKAVVCVVDAEQFVKTAAFMQAAVAQVQFADGILLNKTDLVTPVERLQLQEVLVGMNARAPLRETTFGAIPAGFLEGLTHVPSSGPVVEVPPPHILAVSLQTDRIVDETRFCNTIRRLGSKILRLKGNLCFSKGQRFMEVVGERVIDKDPCPELGTQTQFTVIGWKVSKEELSAAFAACW